MLRHILALMAILALAGVAQARPLTAKMQARAQMNPSITGVQIDLAAFLERMDGQRTADSYQAVSVHLLDEQGERADPVPARMDLVDGVYHVLWQVPAAPRRQPPGELLTFELTLHQTTSPVSHLELPPGTQVNLIPDPDWSSHAAGQLPHGTKARHFQENYQLVQTDTGLALGFKNTEQMETGPAYRTPWIAVEPGQGYVVSYRYKTQEAQRQSRYNLTFYSWINFLDAQGNAVPRLSGARTLASDTDGWQTFEQTITVPPEAVQLDLDVRNNSTVPGSVLVDSLRVAPAVLPEVAELKVAQQQTVSLRTPGESVYRFDLGPKDSPVWDGFTGLSSDMEYQADRGWGFTRVGGYRDQDRVRPDTLARDAVAGRRVDLRVDVPSGEYDVYLLTGDSNVGGVVYWLYFNQQLILNGQTVFTDDTSPEDFFKNRYLKHYDSFWLPGMDYYDTFVAPRFSEHHYVTTVTNDRLMIRWDNMPVAAILIAPRSLHEQTSREWQRLGVQRRRAAQVEQAPGPDEPMPALTQADHDRGFVLFRRPASETIYPSSRPAQGEQIDRLETFAARGQSESVHFSLLPLRDLGNVSVSAGELRSGDRVIPADAVDVRVARYIFRIHDRTRHVRPSYNYQIAPFPLDNREYVRVDDGVTWSWWATVSVPNNAGAGVYEGSLRIEPEHGRAFDLPVRVRVLPFELAELPIVQGFYYTPTDPWYSVFWRPNVMGANLRDNETLIELIRENERRELAFMQSIGLNSAAFGDDLRGDMEYVDGRVQLKENNRLELWMDVYAEAGMGPMPFYGFSAIGSGVGRANRLGWLHDDLKETFTSTWNQAYRSLAEEIRDTGKQRGWPEILFYTTDERSNYGEQGAQQGKKLAQILEDVPGIRTIASMNGPWEQIMPPHLTISMPNLAYPITPETIQAIYDANSDFWLYNVGDQRIALGLYPWRVQAGGRFQWHYRSVAGDPWDELDGRTGESVYSISLPGPDGPVPTLDSEITRAAINDHRYAATLQAAIDAARSQPGKQAVIEQAEQFLDDLRSRIPVDIRALAGFNVDPREAGAALGGEFRNTDALDRVRWATAQYILQLQGNH